MGSYASERTPKVIKFSTRTANADILRRAVTFYCIAMRNNNKKKLVLKEESI